MKYVCRCGNPTDNTNVIGDIVLHTCDECRKKWLERMVISHETEKLQTPRLHNKKVKENNYSL